MKNVSIFRAKKEIIYVLQGCSWRDVLRKTLRFFALWWHFGSQCGQLCAFISISALTHVVFSQRSFGPYGQTSSRSRPNDARNESLPCVHVWSGLCIACPYPCWIVLILFWWIDEVRCHTWPKTTLVPDVPFLSVVVRPRGQRCQNKISFDRLQPEQIKQDEVKSFEFYLVYMYIYFLLCIFISFYVYLFLFMYICLFISYYFFISISFYFCFLLFISFYFSFLAKKRKYDFKMCFFWFSDHPNHVVTNLLQPAPPLSLAECGCHCKSHSGRVELTGVNSVGSCWQQCQYESNPIHFFCGFDRLCAAEQIPSRRVWVAVDCEVPKFVSSSRLHPVRGR